MSAHARHFVPRANRVDVNHEFASVEEFINEYVSNISSSGVFIKSKDPLPVGTTVNLKFTVLMDDIETIEGVGQVVRVSERPKGMGVVFTRLTEHSKDLLAKLLTRRVVAPEEQRAPRAAAQVPWTERGDVQEDASEGRAGRYGAGVRAAARPVIAGGPVQSRGGRAAGTARAVRPPPLPWERGREGMRANKASAADERKLDGPTVVKPPPLEAFREGDAPTVVRPPSEGTGGTGRTGGTGTARRRATPPPPPPPRRRRQ